RKYHGRFSPEEEARRHDLDEQLKSLPSASDINNIKEHPDRIEIAKFLESYQKTVEGITLSMEQYFAAHGESNAALHKHFLKMKDMLPVTLNQFMALNSSSLIAQLQKSNIKHTYGTEVYSRVGSVFR